MAKLNKKKRKKTGRNDPCPCGSGEKYKKCHGAFHDYTPPGSPAIPADELKRKFAEIEAIKKQREKQQGLGRSIISTTFKGARLVAVGNRLYWSDKWKTFHDFLFDYIKHALGSDWGNAELRKSFDQRHPILQWYERICHFQRQHIVKPGEVHSAPMTGAVAAYLGLAYNLYLLAHNVRIQSRLIERLKNIDQFHGAHYETYVAAAFIKAGFELEFEDESDSSSSHCEFTATSKKTGDKYSVEAKSREPNKSSAKIGNQLYNALRKRANHKRVIFIDVNVPDRVDESQNIQWLNEALDDLRSKETSMTINGGPAPEAYVFVTNHPYSYSLETINFRTAVLAEGFKIPDFKMGARFESIRTALDAREKHSDMDHLFSSMRDHYEIPSTFDGEIPEFVFGKTEPRLRIGKKYLLPTDDGKKVIGELTAATISESEKIAYCAYQLEDGKSLIYTCPITDDELTAYKKYRYTFFGTYLRQGKKIDNPLELYDFFYESYSKTPKEKLLEFMKAHPDLAKLKQLSQEELAKIYCERLVYSVINDNKAKSCNLNESPTE